jgi:hypothetical protein
MGPTVSKLARLAEREHSRLLPSTERLRAVYCRPPPSAAFPKLGLRPRAHQIAISGANT